MRVLWLTNIPSPYRVNFFNILGQKCELTVIFERNDADDRETSWLSEKVISFKANYIKGIKFSHETAFCPSILKWINSKSYDIIVVTNYSSPTSMLAIEYMKIRSIPFIIEADGGIINYIEPNSKKRLKQRYLSSASLWLSSGRETNKYFQYYGADPKRIEKYHFSSLLQEDILPELPTNEEKEVIRSKLGLESKFIVISVGSFIKRKNFEFLINSWKKANKEILLILVGSGPDETIYRELINRYDLKNVRIIGFRPKDELLNYYLASDIFIMPTLEDIWGLVINEAMACGLPVITTNKCVAGLELIEDGKNGYILPVNNEEELLNKLHMCFYNKNTMVEMAQNNLKKIKNYTIEKMAEEHYDIFINFTRNYARGRK